MLFCEAALEQGTWLQAAVVQPVIGAREKSEYMPQFEVKLMKSR